jgi:hypothetical protein
MKTKTIYRSSITGKIVTKKYALANPDTTQKETLHICNLREQLSDFFIYFIKNEKELQEHTANEIVDEYLSK